MNKTYYTAKQGLNAPVYVNGVMQMPKFSLNCVSRRYEFTTANELLQDAIEKSVFYKKFIFLAEFQQQYKSEEIKPIAKKITVDNEGVDIPIESVKTVQDAKEYFRSKEIPFAATANKSVVMKICKDNNIIFPNLT